MQSLNSASFSDFIKVYGISFTPYIITIMIKIPFKHWYDAESCLNQTIINKLKQHFTLSQYKFDYLRYTVDGKLNINYTHFYELVSVKSISYSQASQIARCLPILSWGELNHLGLQSSQFYHLNVKFGII